MNRTIQHTAGKINSWLLPVLAFSLPVSTSAVTILAAIVVFFWLVEADFKRKWNEITRNKVCAAVLVYLGVYVVGLLWSEDISTGLGMFTKQWKLLMVPVFLTVVSGEHRHRVMYGFLSGLVLMMVATYLAWFDLLHFGGVTPEHPTRKLFHVVYNPMLAFGFYLLVYDFLWGKKTVGWRIVLAALALLMAFNMFVTEGRTGQIAFFFLFAVLLLQYFKKNILWGIVLVAVIIPLLFSVGYTLSPTFHARVNTAWEEVAQFNYNPNTSVGLRIHFWKISWEIIKQNPLVGVGTCDFQGAYEKMNRELSPRMVATDNPHNQYMLVSTQFGILGLLALLGIFIAQIRQAFTGDDFFKGVRLAFPLFFLLIMLSESYLIVFETGFLFSVFTAVFYKNVQDRVNHNGAGDIL